MVLKFKKLHFILINNWSVIITKQLLILPALTLGKKKGSKHITPPPSPPPSFEIFNKNVMYKITLLEGTGVAFQYRWQWKNHSKLHDMSPPQPPLHPLSFLSSPYSFLIVGLVVSFFWRGEHALGYCDISVYVPNNSSAHSISTLFIASSKGPFFPLLMISLYLWWRCYLEIDLLFLKNLFC